MVLYISKSAISGSTGVLVAKTHRVSTSEAMQEARPISRCQFSVVLDVPIRIIHGASLWDIPRINRMRYHPSPKVVSAVSKWIQFASQRSTAARRMGRKLVAACCWAPPCWGYHKHCRSCRRMLSECSDELPSCLYISNYCEHSLKRSIDVQFSYMHSARSSRHGIPADVLVGQMQSSSLSDSHSASIQDIFVQSAIESQIHGHVDVTYSALRYCHT